MVAASHDGSDAREQDESGPYGSGREGDVGEDAFRPASDDGQPRDEFSEAKDLLQSVPELTDERLAEIKDRIKRGYYKRTDVLQYISKRLTDQLSR